MMDIKQTFLNLTSRTYPHGSEGFLNHLLPKNIETDIHGNKFIKVGKSSVMFTSHLDTATQSKTDVTHVFEGDIIKTDGKSILGADDKAGVTVMLYMIANKIPGLYYFFLGEEVGGIGSGKLARQHAIEKLDINKVISFDRRSTGSVITHQSYKRCCSEKFGLDLAKRLNDAEPSFNYGLDDGGSFTDSANFTNLYAECTNVSVGYYSEHTTQERQDINHLIKLANACLKVKWEDLVVERIPGTTEYKSYKTYGTAYSGYESWGDDYDHYNTYTPARKKQNDPQYFYDVDYTHVCSYLIDYYNSEYLEVDLCKERLEDELLAITQLFDEIELEHSSVMWDGKTLTIHDSNTVIYKVNRKEIIEYLPDLCLVKLEKVMEDKESAELEQRFAS